VRFFPGEAGKASSDVSFRAQLEEPTFDTSDELLLGYARSKDASDERTLAGPDPSE
jgi:hypothetical protein